MLLVSEHCFIHEAQAASPTLVKGAQEERKRWPVVGTLGLHGQDGVQMSGGMLCPSSADISILGLVHS